MANIQLTENLRILRERSNLKQDEFSRYLNISRQKFRILKAKNPIISSISPMKS